MAAGDTVWVKAGTYPEQVTIACVGAAGQEISFAAYPGHTVTVDGSSLTLGEYEGLVQLVNASYVRVRGFHVTHAGPTPTTVGIQVDPGDHVVIENNHTSYTASSGILVWSSSDVLVVGNEVEQPMTLGGDSRNECITVGRTARFEVSANHVHDNTGGRGEGICLKDGSTFGTAYRNHVHHVPAVGIYVDAHAMPTSDIEVVANRVHDVDGNGIVLASEQGGLLERVRVVDNLVYHNRWVGIDVSVCCPDNGVVDHPIDDVEVVNNSVSDNGWPTPDDWGGGFGNENPQLSGLVLRNNAVAGNLSFEITFEGVGLGDAVLDHNLIGEEHGYPGEVCGSDCVLGDPLWLDPVNGDLRLGNGSPAVDHGAAALAPDTDFWGGQRPVGAAVDIGAHERGSTPPLFADGLERGSTGAWSQTTL